MRWSDVIINILPEINGLVVGWILDIFQSDPMTQLFMQWMHVMLTEEFNQLS